MTMYKGEQVTAMIGVAKAHNGRFIDNFYIDVNFIDIALRDDGLIKFCNKDATAESVISYAFNEAVRSLCRSDYMDKFSADKFVVINEYYKGTTKKHAELFANSVKEGTAQVGFDCRYANITFGNGHSDFIKWNMAVNRLGANYLYLYNDWGTTERIAHETRLYGDAMTSADKLTGWLCTWHGFTRDLGDYDVVTTSELNAIIRKRPKLVGDRLVKRGISEYDVETEAKIENIVETLRTEFDKDAVKRTGTSISKATFNWLKEELTQAVTKSVNYKVLH